MNKRVPKFLQSYYTDLNTLIKQDKLREAREYLYSTPEHIYDNIIERATRGRSFYTIVNKIESLSFNHKGHDLFKINNHNGDTNYLF